MSTFTAKGHTTAVRVCGGASPTVRVTIDLFAERVNNNFCQHNNFVTYIRVSQTRIGPLDNSTLGEVSTTCGSGWVRSGAVRKELRTHPATAGGTDLVDVN